ncbi:MAG: putative glycoside hydrolase, partial [Candidatus Krumholzibacteriia bacterium]
MLPFQGSIRRGVLRILVPALTSSAVAAGAQNEPAYPRLANMYLHGWVNPSALEPLAQWDLLILNTVWTEADLQRLRVLNPDIRIFQYVCPYCVESPPNPADPWKQQNFAYAADNDLWWYDIRGDIAADWPGSRMVNITELGGSGPRGTWREYIAQRIEELVFARPSLDGVFLDNYWRQLSWNQDNLQLESDCNPTHDPLRCDGVMDADADLDSLWNRALRVLVDDVGARLDVLEAQRDRPLAILSNRASDYFPWLNGTLYEFFPSGWSNVDPGNPFGYNWYQEMLAVPEGYLVAPFSADPYRVQVINADWTGTPEQPDRSPDFERHKRFTLVSSLLGDGYYSLDAGDQTGHGALWWEPEYDHAGRGKGYLGRPLGAMYSVALPAGPELLANGDFTAGTTGWSSLVWQSVGSFDADTSEFRSPPAAARIRVQSITSDGGHFKVWQSPIAVRDGVGYTLRFWARASHEQDLLVHLYGDGCPGNRC